MKTLRAIKPNQGVRRKYEKRVTRLLERTHRSVVWWIRAAYRKEEDRIVGEDSMPVAMDASPVRVLEKALRKLTRRWEDEWDEAADAIAEEFIDNESTEVTASMIQALKDAGWSVKLPPTRAYNATARAYIDWNVGLIKKIGRDYLDEVESIVLRSTAMGRNVQYLEEELANRFDITRRRAAFIARDQTCKVTNALVRADCESLGVKEAYWSHVPGRKTSRPTHIAMDGKRFFIREGLWDEEVERAVGPGDLPGCACMMRPIVYEPGDERHADREPD